MAAVSAAESPPEIFPWLKTLPLAPEYHPTVAEFQDPIAYILKIEKEASKFGICKIVPPLPPPPKKTAIANLNRSLAARSPNSNPKSPPTFTTRQQQIGFCPRKSRPVQKPVWQSGETYTLQEFEAKAKQFEKTHLRKTGKKALSPLEIETLFWKASVDKPFSVEYANDMPGSAFVPVNGKKWRESGEATTVGDTAWNMRGVSRAKGSLLRFMKEEIPGVTSPMVYIAMMFSWFAWHVEDHDLHSLNYLHMGSAKTWYGVPREAAVAFEEVVRVHGYGGEVNPLVTFAILGEKTTVMSPEVLVSLGIPCCRLVQNAGEFVVTFPRAYHSGFSHGFNCGEAANIATPEWLKVAKEAAIRRASINYPPMVSHFQLLYSLALALCSSIPTSIGTEPRSSRLKDKKRGEGDAMVKELFVQNIMHNNDLLHILLEKGSSCVLLPHSSDMSVCSNLRVGSQKKVKPRLPLSLCSPDETMEASKDLLSEDAMRERNAHLRHLSGFYSVKGKSSSVYGQKSLHALCGNDDLCSSTTEKQSTDTERESNVKGDGLVDQGLFSCVTCGILTFACTAIIQPREAAAQYLMSTDCSVFNDWIVGSEVTSDRYTVSVGDASMTGLNSCSGQMGKGGLYDVPVQSGDYQFEVAGGSSKVAADAEAQKGISSLDLLAVAYDSSDSEDDQDKTEKPVFSDENDFRDSSGELGSAQSDPPSKHKSPLLPEPNHKDEATSNTVSYVNEVSVQDYASERTPGRPSATFMNNQQSIDIPLESDRENLVTLESNNSDDTYRDPLALSRRVVSRSVETCYRDGKLENSESGPQYRPSTSSNAISNCLPLANLAERAEFSDADKSVKGKASSLMQRPDSDSSRLHIFCLEHAVEVEKQLHPIGGVHVLLLCHPEYLKVEAEAKLLAEEMGIDYIWKDVPFREATEEDQQRIRLALDDDEVIPTNGDWAAKLGINLYYSAILSYTPFYSKQMPYNSVIYKAFGRSSPVNSPTKPKVSGKRPGKQKKILVAGRWCGKVWMSNQVHPFLGQIDDYEEELAKSYSTGAMPKEKPERKLDINCQEKPDFSEKKSSGGINTMVAKKSGRKRKRFEKGAIKKQKCLQRENHKATVDEPPEPDTPSGVKNLRTVRSGQMRQETIRHRNDCENNIRWEDSYEKDDLEGGPSTRLRKRPPKKPSREVKEMMHEKQTKKKKAKKAPSNNEIDMKDEEAEYQCDMEGCTMGFSSKQELVLHKRNICSVKGCGKKFFSHKYLVQHRRVHMDDRPLKCPWKGCKMTFKWAWARTEHIRVHTGARPYVCHEPGCGQTFRFVSDFSRHKRKTGHSVKKGKV
ncbi:PREDICTED: lysine-specific demethylase REF6 isoform X2 [Nelumbo nucifera]|uniref:Lysine-specific demethylase REF6 isoform X2 n=1 Tax=Nelumbo nucifera TaxID=4432 RepID=A0A1U7Z660_NELNU|nr:PREDICTED: lysine-specific demethylase REF6 isoform X2 [Nelumbo nucifera]